MSEQEIVNYTQIYFPKGYQQISSNIITIDGNKANQNIIVVNDIVVKTISEQVYFIKNEKTYFITFTTADKDFDKEKANFDIILNSFKVD